MNGPESQNSIESAQEPTLETKRKIFERAGERSPEETLELINNVQGILVQEKIDGQGKLRDTIEEIAKSENGQESFVDGSIAYLPANGEAIFVGDTHGDPESTLSIVEQSQFIEKVSRKRKKSLLIVMGDDSGRGKGDAKNLEQVLALKEKYPDNVILMRGNHEESDTGMRYGLFASLFNKYGPEKGQELFTKYNKLFEKMPGMVVTGNGIVAVHGGIPNIEISSLKDLNEPSGKLLEQMRWNDPSEKIDERDNSYRDKYKGDYKVFGQKPFELFMDTIGGKVMVRGHEAVENGAQRIFGDRLVTIFSSGSEKSISSGYKDQVAMPKYAVINLEQDLERLNETMFYDVEYIEIAKLEPEAKEELTDEKKIRRKTLEKTSEKDLLMLGSTINDEIRDRSKSDIWRRITIKKLVEEPELKNDLIDQLIEHNELFEIPEGSGNANPREIEKKLKKTIKRSNAFHNIALGLRYITEGNGDKEITDWEGKSRPRIFTVKNESYLNITYRDLYKTSARENSGIADAIESQVQALADKDKIEFLQKLEQEHLYLVVESRLQLEYLMQKGILEESTREKPETELKLSDIRISLENISKSKSEEIKRNNPSKSVVTLEEVGLDDIKSKGLKEITEQLMEAGVKLEIKFEDKSGNEKLAQTPKDLKNKSLSALELKEGIEPVIEKMRKKEVTESTERALPSTEEVVRAIKEGDTDLYNSAEYRQVYDNNPEEIEMILREERETEKISAREKYQKMYDQYIDEGLVVADKNSPSGYSFTEKARTQDGAMAELWQGYRDYLQESRLTDQEKDTLEIDGQKITQAQTEQIEYELLQKITEANKTIETIKRLRKDEISDQGENGAEMTAEAEEVVDFREAPPALEGPLAERPTESEANTGIIELEQELDIARNKYLKIVHKRQRSFFSRIKIALGINKGDRDLEGAKTSYEAKLQEYVIHMVHSEDGFDEKTPEQIRVVCLELILKEKEKQSEMEAKLIDKNMSKFAKRLQKHPLRRAGVGVLICWAGPVGAAAGGIIFGQGLMQYFGEKISRRWGWMEPLTAKKLEKKEPEELMYRLAVFQENEAKKRMRSVKEMAPQELAKYKAIEGALMKQDYDIEESYSRAEGQGYTLPENIKTEILKDYCRDNIKLMTGSHLEAVKNERIHSLGRFLFAYSPIPVVFAALEFGAVGVAKVARGSGKAKNFLKEEFSKPKE
jgi:protein phosphatase